MLVALPTDEIRASQHLRIAARFLLACALLGVVLLALVVGLVLIAEGTIEIALCFIMREYERSIWILIDGVVTLVL